MGVESLAKARLRLVPDEGASTVPLPAADLETVAASA